MKYEYIDETGSQLLLPGDFFLPFGGKLRDDNRWVQLARLVPWSKVEQDYAKAFKKSFKGQKPVSIRVALGALLIQQRQNLTDRETVEQISENPYLQYFIGLSGYQDRKPFHHSLMTHFRKRLNAKILNQVNEWIAVEAAKQDEANDDDDTPKGATSKANSSAARQKPGEEDPNQGTLILDASCAPADIAYPTDVSLLNEAREKLEAIIDTLHDAREERSLKPRSYREKARKAYLEIAKQRKAGKQKIRKAIGQQLRFVRRDLRIVEQLVNKVGLSALSTREYRNLLVVRELYRQQFEMHQNHSHHIEDRIVNLTQPHVRPIVRGKAKAKVEFGAKIAISMVNGYTMMEKQQWDNFNEGTTLIESVEAYRTRFGYYPEAVLADQIYRNRENRTYCKERGIRMSGPALGRPSQEKKAELRKQAKQDAGQRNAVEGKFGEGKRRYGLGLISTRLRETSETVIALQLIMMNLERRLRVLFASILDWLETEILSLRTAV